MPAPIPWLIDREPRRGRARRQREQGTGDAHAHTASRTQSRQEQQAGTEKMNPIRDASPNAFWQNEAKAKTAMISVGRSRGPAQALSTRSIRPIRDELARTNPRQEQQGVQWAGHATDLRRHCTASARRKSAERQNKAVRGKINEFNGGLRQPPGRPKTLSNSGEGKTAEQSHSTKTQQIQCGCHAGAQGPLAAPFWQNKANWDNSNDFNDVHRPPSRCGPRSNIAPNAMT
jgi:hypothetical protein